MVAALANVAVATLLASDAVYSGLGVSKVGEDIKFACSRGARVPAARSMVHSCCLLPYSPGVSIVEDSKQHVDIPCVYQAKIKQKLVAYQPKLINILHMINLMGWLTRMLKPWPWKLPSPESPEEEISLTLGETVIVDSCVV